MQCNGPQNPTILDNQALMIPSNPKPSFGVRVLGYVPGVLLLHPKCRTPNLRPGVGFRVYASVGDSSISVSHQDLVQAFRLRCVGYI